MSVINYANLNRRGFNSTKSVRTKPIDKRKGKTTDKTDKDAVKTKNKAGTNKSAKHADSSQHETAETLHENLSRMSDNTTMVTLNSAGILNIHDDKALTPVNTTVNVGHARQSVNALTESINNYVQTSQKHNSEYFTDMASLAKRKRIVQQEIEAMEKQLQQEEEDDELKDLLKKRQQLKQQLASTASETSDSVIKKSSKGNKVKNKNNVSSEDRDCVDLTTLAEQIGDSAQSELPSMAEIHDLLHVTDKKARRKRSRKLKKKRGKSRRKVDTSTSESEDSTSSESESSDEVKHPQMMTKASNIKKQVRGLKAVSMAGLVTHILCQMNCTLTQPWMTIPLVIGK